MGNVIREIFVPDYEDISSKIMEIKQRFGFVTHLQNNFVELKEYLFDSGNEIPKITINLGNTEGKYNYGQSAKVLDLTWYARYKVSVDLVIVALVYMFFIWNTYKRLPDIIGGSGAITSIIKTSSRK